MSGRASTAVTLETLSEMASEADRLDFLMSATMMRKFDDVNVVYLHGVVTCNSSPQLIVMEHVKYGPLLQFVRVRMITREKRAVVLTCKPTPAAHLMTL